MIRKEKRKAMKKMKRKQVRKEREEAEAWREKEMKEFKESERAWREAMEIKRKKKEEEERRCKDLEESRKDEDDECGGEEDGEYEYMEEGPPEIIFKGNEIILRKNKVKISSAFLKYQNFSSAQQILDSVPQEVPNFETEQTGACRFGPRCSRLHFHPDKSCTILMKNMYNGPGIAWEQEDEGLEVFTFCIFLFLSCFPCGIQMRKLNVVTKNFMKMFQKHGELINFKKWLIPLEGKCNMYTTEHWNQLFLPTSALMVDIMLVTCEFANISRWKVLWGTCSRGGDYEWADNDKPPPRF
ncbi:hypothetical protein F2Q68_00040591 [Brassica cretica]|uniref:C3H1-type domain-containing protein n=1 Tax=Brassica cretica TaxID=69181 RepID=A0A8S9MRL9_BRACR|nr:hypothetical protein F2Q68_00040591 [Brassica cretica]